MRVRARASACAGSRWMRPALARRSRVACGGVRVDPRRWRAGHRDGGRSGCVAMAAMLAGLTVLAALYLFQTGGGAAVSDRVVRVEHGSLQTARNFLP